MKNKIIVGVLVVLVLGACAAIILWPSGQEEVIPADVSKIVQPAPPSHKIAVPVGTTTFCLQLDGRGDGHLPDLMGAAAKDAYPNGLNGRNWSLPGTSTGAEPYGMLPDGTIFAKIAFLQQYGMVQTCALKADRTGWQPVQGTAQKINGEDALAWK